MDNVIVNIDTRFRNKKLYPNAGKFTFHLNEKIKDVMYIRLSSVEIPNLYFTFSDKKDNTSFKISINNYNYKIKIDEGFYTSNQILQAILDQFDPIPGSLNIILNLANGYITIESDTIFNIDFSNSGEYESLGHHLGFRQKNYTAKQKVVNGNTVYYIVSESQLDVIGDNYVMLRVNDYGKMYNFKHSDEKQTKEDIDTYLGKVIITTAKAEKNFDNNNFITKMHIFRQPTNISKFEIELIDPLKNTVDTVFMDYSLTLELGIIHDKHVYEKYLNDIHYQLLLNGLIK